MDAYARYIDRQRLAPSFLAPAPLDVLASGSPLAKVQRLWDGGHCRNPYCQLQE
jgi:hypothetical protein